MTTSIREKYLLLFIASLIILHSNISISQCINTCGSNLVPNANFETTSAQCSDTISELFYSYTSVENWYGTEDCCDAGSTPDYQNINCNSLANEQGCGVGNGSVGLYTTVNAGGGLVLGGTVSQNREYVQVKLSSPLEAGERYCASMIVKSTFTSPVLVATDGIGMWLTENKVNINTQNGGEQFIGPGSLVNATPQVQNTSGNIIDSTCTIVSGTFCANGGEEWLVIGNFLPDLQIVYEGSGFFGSKLNYMIIDDVNLQMICPPDPQLNITDYSIVCGESIDVEITNSLSNSSIEWLSPSNYTGNTTPGPFSDSPSSTTEYEAVVTSDNGCGIIYKDTLTKTVTVECGPEIILAASSDTLCVGGCTNIEANITGGIPPYTITWNNDISNGSGPYTICPLTTTTYNAIVTDQNGDTDNATITVSVGTPDSTYLQHSICNGSSINIYGNTYTSSGIYPKSFINIYGCDSIEYNEVILLPASGTVDVSRTNLSDCSQSDGEITFTGLLADSVYSISYDYSGIIIGPQSFTANSVGEIKIPGLSEGTYTNFEISILGCSITLADVLLISSPNSPTADAGADQEICENESITLITNTEEDETISWNNGVTNGVAFQPSAGTHIYTVTITNASNCEASDDVEVTVNPTPIIDIGQDISLCEGDNVTLEINGNDTYTWDQGVTNGVEFTPNLGTTTYTVTATDQNGCTSNETIDITVNDSPDVNILVNDSSGCAPLTIEFSTSSTSNGDQCLWVLNDGTTNTDCGTISHTFENPGCYDITLTQTSGTTGCTSTVYKEDLICIGIPPDAAFNYNPSDPSEINPQVNFINQSTGAHNYSWTFNNNDISNEVNPIYTFPMMSGKYTVELVAHSILGCNDTIIKDIFIDEALLYYVPNAFTPDGNGPNDVFLPVMTSGFDPYDYKLLIFNRWGEIIFESLNPYKGWDGTYNGKIVADGVYIWTIEFKDNNTDENYRDQGQINVIR